jgi:hypothetical protein
VIALIVTLAHALIAEGQVGLLAADEDRAWGDRAGRLYKHIGLGRGEVRHGAVWGAALRWEAFEDVEFGVGYRHLSGTLAAGGPEYPQTHETTVDAALLDVRLLRRFDPVFLFLQGAPGVWRTEVTAYGHLGGGHETTTVPGAELAFGVGARLVHLELSLRLAHAWFELPALEDTYYAVGGAGGGWILGVGLGWRQAFGEAAAE